MILGTLVLLVAGLWALVAIRVLAGLVRLAVLLLATVVALAIVLF